MLRKQIRNYLLLPIALLLVACAGTRSAYQYADTLDKKAYVVTQHYASLVHEAADIAALPGTPQAVKDSLKAADKSVKPFIVGDPTKVPPVPGLSDLAASFKATRDAKTEAELQAAIDKALVELSTLVNAVNAARKSP